jgi:putative transposase
MARSRYKIYNNDQPHFLTITIIEWIPLFMNKEIVAILLRSLEFLQQERNITIYAYVIMENHFHIIASNNSLGKTIKEFKSFTARCIIDYLQERRSFPILEKLRRAKLSHKTQSTYQVWQEGSHPQEIFDEKKFIQKIEYIHNNPVRRGYVDEPSQWRYSSARNYDGRIGLLNIKTDWRNDEAL